jgi:hypothetical protein
MRRFIFGHLASKPDAPGQSRLALSATSPSVAIRLLTAIARELRGRLRTANRTIHQLDT